MNNKDNSVKLETLIDLIYAIFPDKIVCSGVRETGISDHCIELNWNLLIQWSPRGSCTMTYRNVWNFSLEIFRNGVLSQTGMICTIWVFQVLSMEKFVFEDCWKACSVENSACSTACLSLDYVWVKETNVWEGHPENSRKIKCKDPVVWTQFKRQFIALSKTIK